VKITDGSSGANAPVSLDTGFGGCESRYMRSAKLRTISCQFVIRQTYDSNRMIILDSDQRFVTLSIYTHYGREGTLKSWTRTRVVSYRGGLHLLISFRDASKYHRGISGFHGVVCDLSGGLHTLHRGL